MRGLVLTCFEILVVFEEVDFFELERLDGLVFAVLDFVSELEMSLANIMVPAAV